MKVSVIIPAYKFAKYIEQSILSALWQKTNFDFEVLVRDDFSKDGSDTIIKRIRFNNPNLRYFESTENWGGYKNIKFLCEQAKGEYIAYLDGDDYFTDQYKLQKQVDFLDNNLDYSTHSMGYFTVNNGVYHPVEYNLNLISRLSDVTTEDLFVENYVSFGRMFRNYKNLFKDYMENIPFLDYAINYELSLRGKIKCDELPGGVYRTHENSVFTLLPKEDKEKIKTSVIKILKERYLKDKMKIITIVDCFVDSKSVENKLNNFVTNFDKSNSDILLVSNKIVNSEILSKVKYYIYDSNNRLFKGDYTNIENVVLSHVNEGLTIRDTDPGLQRHGLSVLVNLFNSLNFAKSLGYTHFQRFEVDDLISRDGWEFVKNVPELCLKNNKKGMFYFNHKQNSDISFHYFFCEIEYFLNTIGKIMTEEDYRKYIYSKRQNYDFMNVEEYIYHNIIDNDKEKLILQRSGEIQQIDFAGTYWNTECSESNKPKKYEGCTTKIYKINKNENQVAIVSFNYSDNFKNRLIKCYYDNGNVIDINQITNVKNSWSYNIIDNNDISKLIYIEVYENEDPLRFLYKEENKNILSILIFQ